MDPLIYYLESKIEKDNKIITINKIVLSVIILNCITHKNN